MKTAQGLTFLCFIYSWVPINSYEHEHLGMDILLPYLDHHGPKHRTNRDVSECQHIKYGSITHTKHKAYKSVNLTFPLVDYKYQLKSVDYFDKRDVTVLFQTINNPLQTFSVLEPHGTGSCTNGSWERATVQDSARQKNCYLASNAGFFNTHTGECYGNIISDGQLAADSGGVQNVHFGITKDGYIYTGYLSELDLLTQKFTQLVGGVLWLLRDGEQYIDESLKIECSEVEETGTLESFTTVKSARTAVGHDRDGRILMAQIDGKTGSLGVDLHEFASILKDLGFVNAVNLDGGGSVTTVINGTVVNHPSDKCPNSDFNCPRHVSTVLCVHEPECRPLDCSSQGSCQLGVCECRGHWSGSACDRLSCPADCSGHGICTEVGCECNDGWYGESCFLSCPRGKYGLNCSLSCSCQNNASCDPVTGQCDCPPGFTGEFCQSVCPYGFYGLRCASVCNCDTSCFCDNVNGSCNVTVTGEDEVLTDYQQAGSCVAQQLIRERDLVPNQADQYRLCLTSSIVLGVVSAVSIIFNISFICVYLNSRKQHTRTAKHSRKTNKAHNNFVFHRLSSNDSGTDDTDASQEMIAMFKIPPNEKG